MSEHMKTIGNIALIQEIKKHPELWDVNHMKYNKRFYMAKAWKVISRKLNFSEQRLKRKWINLRDTFGKEFKKCPSKSVHGYTGTWKYFHNLEFLKVRYLTEDENMKRDNGVEAKEIIKMSVETDFDDQTYNEENANITKNEDSWKSSKWQESTCGNSEVNEISNDNETVVEFIIKNEDGDHNYHDRPEEITYIEENDQPEIDPPKNEMYYETIFLKSLAPYFRQLNPMRKLVLRSKIQNLLLDEIVHQW